VGGEVEREIHKAWHLIVDAGLFCFYGDKVAWAFIVGELIFTP